jgi:voltage-gated potassium channel
VLERLRHRVYQILEEPSRSDYVGRSAQGFLLTVICVNVVAMMLGSVADLAAAYKSWFDAIEFFSVIVFTVEYVLRLWVITRSPRFHRPILGRLRYAVTPLALVDLVAVLPFYLPMLLPVNLLFIRVLRLMRLMRLLKIGRYSESLQTLGWVLRERKGELAAALMLLLVLLVITSSLMFQVEHDAQPEAFPSVFAAMWWSVSTLTTVGYGDVYPVTALGKFLGGAIAILGIGLFALPAGILGSGFVEKLGQRKRQRLCPHCGKDIDEPAAK